MFRQIALAAALGAAALVIAPTPRADARDALTSSFKSIRKDYKQDTKDATATFNTAVKNLEKGLSAGSAENSAAAFGEALAFYTAQLKIAGDAAADAFANDVAAAMLSANDDDLKGGVSGDGGSADKFAEAIRADLQKLRAKARKRSLKFAKAIEKTGARVRMRVAFEAWPFQSRPAADGDGAFPVRPEAPALWGAVATRLTDGRVIISAFGSADASLDGQFDVRLEGTLVRALGTFLSERGMDVTPDGTWSFTGEVGNPFIGDGLDEGNRQIHFGVDPFDPGLGGPQPSRLVHGGLISIP